MLRTRLTEALDFIVAADPGATRLTIALEAALAISVVIALEYGFAQIVHPFWLTAPAGAGHSAAAAAQLAAQHHGVTLILMLLAGIFAMISSIAVSDVSPGPQAITLLGAPVGMLGAMAAAIALHSHHWIGVAGLTLVVGIGTWVRRFGPRFFFWGALGFMGFFFGFLAGAELPLARFYWLAAALYLAATTALALRVAVFNRVGAGAVQRGRTSFAARARRVLDAAGDVNAIAEASDRRRPRRALDRQLLRLNESALMFDGQLADPRSRLSAGDAQSLHEQLFDLELGLDNLARITAELAAASPSSALRARIGRWLSELRAGRIAPDARDWDATLAAQAGADVLPELERDRLYALAALVTQTGERLREWTHPSRSPEPGTGAGLLTDIYRSPVSLFGGFLAGSAVAARDPAAGAGGAGLAARLGLDSASQNAIRVMVAVGGAAALGSVVSERRFYWAAIAGFIAFMGANTAGEQVSKAAARVTGTFLGILIGSLVASLIGDSTWSLAVILPAVSFGIYMQRVSYSLMATGITIMIAMLYVQLGEFSHSLLALRLELTALGGVVATLAALLVLPVSTLRVTRLAAISYLSALRELLGALPDAIAAAPRTPELSRQARAMDDALMQTLVSARPLAREPFRHRALQHNLVLLSTSAHWARNLASTIGRVDGIDDLYRGRFAAAAREEADAVGDLTRAMGAGETMGAHHPPLEPVAECARFLADSGVRSDDPRRQLLRSLLALDGTLVRLEHNLGGAPIAPGGAGGPQDAGQASSARGPADDGPTPTRASPAGDGGTPTGGDGGTPTAGDRGTPTAGDRGTPAAGDGGTPAAGDGRTDPRPTAPPA